MVIDERASEGLVLDFGSRPPIQGSRLAALTLILPEARDDVRYQLWAMQKEGSPRHYEAATVAELDVLAEQTNPDWNVFFAVAVFPEGTSRSRENAVALQCVWADCDDQESNKAADAFGQLRPPHVIIETSPGRTQRFWRLEERHEGDRITDVIAMVRSLAERLGSDRTVAEAARLLRVPSSQNTKYEDRPVVRIIRLDDARPGYTLGDFEDVGVLMDYDDRVPQADKTASQRIPQGARNSTLLSLAGSMRRRGMVQGAIEAALLVENRERCDPPLEDFEVRTVAASTGRYSPGGLLAPYRHGQPTSHNKPRARLIEHLRGDYRTTPPVLVLHPYIPLGGHVALFGPPDSGKTYVSMSMAVSIDAGSSTVWDVRASRRTLYINLERSKDSLAARLGRVNAALGLPGDRSLRVLTTRGMKLAEVEDQLQREIDEEGVEVVFIDALGRAASGSMKDDDKANDVLDLAARLCDTVVFIGHTPRGDESHIWGVIQLDAAFDVMVQATSKLVDPLHRTVKLSVTKANDITRPEPAAVVLSFELAGLTGIERGDSGVVPSLADDIETYLKTVESDHVTAIATAVRTENARNAIGHALKNNPDRFEQTNVRPKHRKRGGPYWRLKS
ncbi:MAG: AAA family ATPase [Dehalococcoidia bacterium]